MKMQEHLDTTNNVMLLGPARIAFLLLTRIMCYLSALVGIRICLMTIHTKENILVLTSPYWQEVRGDEQGIGQVNAMKTIEVIKEWCYRQWDEILL